jgi:hypothetical protein
VVAAMEWRTIAADFVCSDQRLVEAVMGHGSFKGDCCTKCLTKKAAAVMASILGRPARRTV